MSLKEITDLQIFIISWKDQHANVIHIANQLNEIKDKVSIVYSDPNPDYKLDVDCNLIKRPNDLFWGDKLKACVENSNSENILIIQGDCTHENWVDVVLRYEKARKEIKSLGCWSPVVDFAHLGLKLTSILDHNNPEYEIVCFMDLLVFGVSRKIQSRIKNLNYDLNIYGWMTGHIVAANAALNNQLLIIDKSVLVKHPRKRGYDTSDAFNQGSNFFKNQATYQEKVYVKLVIAFVKTKEQMKK